MLSATAYVTYGLQVRLIKAGRVIVRTAIVLSEESLWSNYYLVEGFFCRLSSRDPYRNRLIFKWINIFSVNFKKDGEKITHLIHTFLSFSILIVLICDHTKIPCDHLFFLRRPNIQIFKYLQFNLLTN